MRGPLLSSKAREAAWFDPSALARNAGRIKAIVAVIYPDVMHVEFAPSTVHGESICVNAGTEVDGPEVLAARKHVMPIRRLHARQLPAQI